MDHTVCSRGTDWTLLKYPRLRAGGCRGIMRRGLYAVDEFVECRGTRGTPGDAGHKGE